MPTNIAFGMKRRDFQGKRGKRRERYPTTKYKIDQEQYQLQDSSTVKKKQAKPKSALCSRIGH